MRRIRCRAIQENDRSTSKLHVGRNQNGEGYHSAFCNTRSAVISQRRGQAKLRRVIADDEKYVHFVTFSCERRRRLLDMDQPRRILLGVLNHQLTPMSARRVGFVVMPEHVHALIWLPETGELSRFMHGWKRMSSFRIRNWYRENEATYFANLEMGDRFWQPKYYSFSIYSRRKLEELLRSMHLNPVRAGLVDRVIDWAWNSDHWYGRSADRLNRADGKILWVT